MFNASLVLLQAKVLLCAPLRSRSFIKQTATFKNTLSATQQFIPMASHDSTENLVWVDLEMTGLDIEKDLIIEMACLITDGNLNIIAESRDLIIHQPDFILDNMNNWCKQQHGKTGLTEAVRKSTTSVADAENEMVDFVKKFCPEKVPLAGSSVHVDKKFLDKYMPKFTDCLHYRIVDVSSIKELAKRWYPYVQPPTKNATHRAMSDIHESIKELKFYKTTLFKPPNQGPNM
uniref:Oligoribonuclease, mitochondrial n=1 Tax=Phallusia mammillata TaxID=59560 RepID=A0A6F9DQS3_9ASCI|nr:probable oligoribonuclease [Phallusia mammillata]